jgi:hypothetical protein
MADEFQNLPILPSAAILRVQAADPDARSGGDGHLSDLPDRRSKPAANRPTTKKSTVVAAPAPINPSILLQDEAQFTHCAQLLQGRARPAPVAATDPTPAVEPSHPTPSPAPAAHIRITA